MRNVEYELVVWVGCQSIHRGVWHFPITNNAKGVESMKRALKHLKEDHRIAVEHKEDGMPYISVYKWVDSDLHEYGDQDGAFDDTFDKLPKYVQKLIKPLLEYQSTIEY